MSQEPLKACPWCGSPAEEHTPKSGDYQDDPDVQPSYSCSARGCMASHYAMDLDAWNTRQGDGENAWQPIETAPKTCDPSVMLSSSSKQDVWMDFWDEDGECWANQSEYGLPTPTHWQPLPQPPRTEKCVLGCEGGIIFAKEFSEPSRERPCPVHGPASKEE